MLVYDCVPNSSVHYECSYYGDDLIMVKARVAESKYFGVVSAYRTSQCKYYMPVGPICYLYSAECALILQHP